MEITVYKAEERLLNLAITDENDNLLDLTDKEVNLVVVNDLGQTDSEVIDLNAYNKNASGDCDILLSDEDTDIQPGLYWFEVWVEYGDGTDYVAEQGDLFVQKRGEPY